MAFWYIVIEHHKMTEQEFKILISKKQQGLLNNAEEAILLSFEKKMIEKNSKTIFLNDKHKSKIRSDIYSKINHTKLKRFNGSWMRIAAILIIALSIGGLGWLFTKDKTQVVNVPVMVAMLTKEASYGKKLTFNLPDGSKVKLNSGSKIEYPEIFKDSIREVTITGEAFFEIKKDSLHPFIVKTSLLSTRVLGTTFNIKAYEDEDDIAVTLATGIISVDLNGNDDMILAPSYQANFNKLNQSFTKQKINLDKFLGWKDGILRFDDEKLATALPKLEKWFNVKIRLQSKSSAECSFTGIFKDASLESILDNITFVKTNLKYKFISSNKVQISGYCNN